MIVSIVLIFLGRCPMMSGRFDDKLDMFVGLCNSATVLSFIHRSVPTAILVEEVGTEMTFVLPLQDNTTAGFYHLFQTLDSQLENLHIASYGVSDTTLEEVHFTDIIIFICHLEKCQLSLVHFN